MGKEDAVHIYNGILLRHKKDQMMPFAVTCMDVEIVVLSKVSWIQEKKYHMILLTCGI